MKEIMKQTILVTLIFLLSIPVFAEKSDQDYIKDLKSEKEDIRKDAVRHLGKKKLKEGVDPLIAVLTEDKDPQVRMLAASSLGLMEKENKITEALRKNIESDTDNAVVYTSLLSLLNQKNFENQSSVKALEYCEKNKMDDPFISDAVKRIRKAMTKK